MVKKTFTRKEIVRNGIIRIPYDKYDLLMDIIRREFVD